MTEQGAANSAKFAEIRARAEAQRRYQEVEELNDWPVDDVLALVEVAEAAQSFLAASASITPDTHAAYRDRWPSFARLEEALQKLSPPLLEEAK